VTPGKKQPGRFHHCLLTLLGVWTLVYSNKLSPTVAIASGLQYTVTLLYYVQTGKSRAVSREMSRDGRGLPMSRSLYTPTLSCLAFEGSTPPSRLVFGSNSSFRDWKRSQRQRQVVLPTLILPPPSVPHALLCCLFCKRYFAWIVSSWSIYLLNVLGTAATTAGLGTLGECL
jgi:hypothetical protein